LTLLYYRDYGLRPMEDFGVLVKTEQASAAIDLLRELGWKPKLKLLEQHTSYKHAAEFTNNDSQEIDLHWNLLAGFRQKKI